RKRGADFLASAALEAGVAAQGAARGQGFQGQVATGGGDVQQAVGAGECERGLPARQLRVPV
ncbi:hypothetical protein ACUY1T_21975, partial [Billgrantia sp. Q4P2]|uniref:hypothetical protein n=1 Tax=Billgrantia sp. Q4P2 TaxID=3463857 RepID=UPI00405784C9